MRGTAALLLGAGSAIAFIPFSPIFPDASLDSGWAFAVNTAVAKGLVFGRDVVFTFGPYGSIYSTQYGPATDGLMLAGGALLAAAFAAGVLCLARGGAMWASLGFALFLPLLWHDAQMFALPLVMLLVAYRIALPASDIGHIALDLPVTLALALLTAALAMLPLIKGTLALASGVTLLLSCTMLALGGAVATAVATMMLYAAMLPLLWVLSPQPLWALAGFFRSQSAIITGYSGAMAVHGPAWHLLVYVTCCSAFAVAHWRQLAASRAGIVLATGIALLLFLGFKEGFVRHDQHAVTGGDMLAVAGWGGLLIGNPHRLTRAAWLIGIIGSAAIALPVALPLYGSGLSARLQGVMGPYFEAPLGLAARLLDTADLQDSYDDSLAAIRTRLPLPTVSGPTDIYSYGQSALLAAGLDWDPRPVLQSYSAYTPSLLRADAAHLAGPGTPRNIIFALQPIDGRLPALEDGASWKPLLAGYRFAGYADNAAIVFTTGQTENVAILTRRTTPLDLAFQPELTGVFKLGAAVPLPAAMVWAQIVLKPSFAGRLLGLLYKPPALTLTYALPGGQSHDYRYVAGAGESGFLIAPMVDNIREFVALDAAPGGTPPAAIYPRSFRLTAFSPHWAWQTYYRLRLSTLRITD
jgi:hypothetical protein